MKVTIERACLICGATEGLRRVAIMVDRVDLPEGLTLDRVALEMQPILCPPHCDDLILRYGTALGEMLRKVQ